MAVSEMVTINFSMDRKTYNLYKSIITADGENVKGNIVRYMQDVIRYNMPNSETILAIKEVEDLKKDPNKKIYSSLDDLWGDLDNGTE